MTPPCRSPSEFYLVCGRQHCTDLVVRAYSGPWNCLLSGYMRRRMFAGVLDVFSGMFMRSPTTYADCYTYSSVLKAGGGLGWILCGSMVHCSVLKSGFVSDVVVASSAVGMYAKRRVFENAVKLFDVMYARDVSSWAAMMSCYPEKAWEFHGRMKCAEVEPNVVTFTIVVAREYCILKSK